MKQLLKIAQNDRGSMSLQKPEIVPAASERQYTAPGVDNQARFGGIDEWRKGKNEIDARILKANAVLRELYRSMVT